MDRGADTPIFGYLCKFEHWAPPLFQTGHQHGNFYNTDEIVFLWHQIKWSKNLDFATKYYLLCRVLIVSFMYTLLFLFL